jgi:hypothetical protein
MGRFSYLDTKTKPIEHTNKDKKLNKNIHLVI